VGADTQPAEIGAVATHPLQERARITPERNAVMDQPAAQDSWNDDYQITEFWPRSHVPPARSEAEIGKSLWKVNENRGRTRRAMCGSLIGYRGGPCRARRAPSTLGGRRPRLTHSCFFEKYQSVTSS